MPTYSRAMKIPGAEFTAAPLRIFTTFANAKDKAGALPLTVPVTVLDRHNRLRNLIASYVNSKPTELFVFNGEVSLITAACLIKLCSPTARGRIVAVDMVLRVPKTAKARLAAWVRSRLWTQVDQYIHYFKDLRGFSSHYGIGAVKSDYVPFKANLFAEAIAHKDKFGLADGNYVFSAGRSLRDYQTLIEAARISGLPTAILFTSQSDWAAHGTALDIDNLPSNVRLIPDTGGKQGWLEGLQGARMVVVPTLPESICASGIGTYLDAMALGKPVIISRGPGADDVLTDQQARFVAPAEPEALAQAMRQLWDNNNAATTLAANGQRYALGLGDEQALLARIFCEALNRAARDSHRSAASD